jgi:hypothetical protein
MPIFSRLAHQFIRWKSRRGLRDESESVDTATHLVGSTSSSRKFELFWTSYVTYKVQNESDFAFGEYKKAVAGSNLRIFSRSRSLEYLSASFATSEYPKPFQHDGLSFENHIVNVVSEVAPLIIQLGLCAMRKFGAGCFLTEGRGT